jgi:hypothetical protein
MLQSLAAAVPGRRHGPGHPRPAVAIPTGNPAQLPIIASATRADHDIYAFTRRPAPPETQTDRSKRQGAFTSGSTQLRDGHRGMIPRTPPLRSSTSSDSSPSPRSPRDPPSCERDDSGVGAARPEQHVGDQVGRRPTRVSRPGRYPAADTPTSPAGRLVVSDLSPLLCFLFSTRGGQIERALETQRKQSHRPGDHAAKGLQLAIC